MLLIVGLGNPGPKYEKNRHNIGFMAVDEIAGSFGLPAFRARFHGLVTEGTLAGEKVMILKPLTFMNKSGQAVGEAMRFFKLQPEQVIVIYDDLDLKPGKVKVKRGGGHGGHNGLRDIDAHIGKDYQRVRLGIGHPGDKDKVMPWVLADFARDEQNGWLQRLIPGVADEIESLVAGDDGRFMSRMAHIVFPPPPKPERLQKDNRPEGAGSLAEDNKAGKAETALGGALADALKKKTEPRSEN